MFFWKRYRLQIVGLEENSLLYQIQIVGWLRCLLYWKQIQSLALTVQLNRVESQLAVVLVQYRTSKRLKVPLKTNIFSNFSLIEERVPGFVALYLYDYCESISILASLSSFLVYIFIRFVPVYLQHVPSSLFSEFVYTNLLMNMRFTFFKSAPIEALNVLSR